jgi:hypothetical protein
MMEDPKPDVLMCTSCKTIFIECEMCWCILNSKYSNHDCPVWIGDEGIENEQTVFPCEESGWRKCRLMHIGTA